MSFSFSFIAKTKSDARARIAKEHAPGAVKAFVEHAIDALPDTGFDWIDVKANGHLAESGSGGYGTSTANIMVAPGFFSK